MPKPDLLVYLHKDIEKLRSNIKSRGRDYEQNISSDYLENLEKGYWEFFKQQDGFPILVIDTNNVDFVKNDKDYQKILDLLEMDYTPGIHRVLLEPVS